MGPDKAPPAVKPLTLSDRLVSGAVAALFGSMLGASMAVLAAVATGGSIAVTAIAIASAAYFCAIGLIRGPDGGYFVGEAFGAVAGATAAEAGAAPVAASNASTPRAWNSVGLVIGWCLLMLLVAWIA